MRKQTGENERTAKHGENEMSDEKRIDRIERLVEENAKGIVELRRMVTERFSKSLVDNAKAREDDAKAWEKMLIDNAKAREKMLIDNAEAREALHKVSSKISQDNAVLPRRMLAAALAGGALPGLVMMGAMLFQKIFGGG